MTTCRMMSPFTSRGADTDNWVEWLTRVNPTGAFWQQGDYFGAVVDGTVAGGGNVSYLGDFINLSFFNDGLGEGGTSAFRFEWHTTTNNHGTTWRPIFYAESSLFQNTLSVELQVRKNGGVLEARILRNDDTVLMSKVFGSATPTNGGAGSHPVFDLAFRQDEIFDTLDNPSMSVTAKTAVAGVSVIEDTAAQGLMGDASWNGGAVWMVGTPANDAHRVLPFDGPSGDTVNKRRISPGITEPDVVVRLIIHEEPTVHVRWADAGWEADAAYYSSAGDEGVIWIEPETVKLGYYEDVESGTGGEDRFRHFVYYAGFDGLYLPAGRVTHYEIDAQGAADDWQPIAEKGLDTGTITTHNEDPNPGDYLDDTGKAFSANQYEDARLYTGLFASIVDADNGQPTTQLNLKDWMYLAVTTDQPIAVRPWFVEYKSPAASWTYIAGAAKDAPADGDADSGQLGMGLAIEQHYPGQTTTFEQKPVAHVAGRKPMATMFLANYQGHPSSTSGFTEMYIAADTPSVGLTAYTWASFQVDADGSKDGWHAGIISGHPEGFGLWETLERQNTDWGMTEGVDFGVYTMINSFVIYGDTFAESSMQLSMTGIVADLVVPIDDDLFIDDASTAANFGTDTQLDIGLHSGKGEGLRRSFVRADASDDPPGGETFDEVLLELYSVAGSSGVDLRRAVGGLAGGDGWYEPTGVWAGTEFIAFLPSGGDLTKTPTQLGVPSQAARKWSSWDIKELWNDARDNQSDVLRVLIKRAAEISGSDDTFSSSDHTAIHFRPLVCIIYKDDVGITGIAVCTLPSLGSAATGALHPSGTIVATLPSLVAAAVGEQPYEGASVLTLPALAVSAAGTVTDVTTFGPPVTAQVM